MIHLFGVGDQAVWMMASGVAAVLFGLITLRMQRARKMFASMGLGRFTTATFSALWLAVMILIINAAVPVIQGAGPYAAAVKLCLGTVMWSFVRRIASLRRPEAHGDWDLSKD